MRAPGCTETARTFKTDVPNMLDPAAFVAKWRANARNGRAAAQEHFLDLCALLDEPTPNSDPTGATYAFEKGATKASGVMAGPMCGDAGALHGNIKANIRI